MTRGPPGGFGYLLQVIIFEPHVRLAAPLPAVYAPHAAILVDIGDGRDEGGQTGHWRSTQARAAGGYEWTHLVESQGLELAETTAFS